MEAKYSKTDEVYVQVYGVDSEGTPTGSMCFWRFGDEEIVEGRIYIVRGLKVVMGQAWDDDAQKYKARADLPKKLECSRRTAVEDVTEIQGVARLFA